MDIGRARTSASTDACTFWKKRIGNSKIEEEAELNAGQNICLVNILAPFVPDTGNPADDADATEREVEAIVIHTNDTDVGKERPLFQLKSMSGSMVSSERYQFSSNR